MSYQNMIEQLDKNLANTVKELNAIPGVAVRVTSRQEVLQKLQRGECVPPATRRLLMLG